MCVVIERGIRAGIEYDRSQPQEQRKTRDFSGDLAQWHMGDDSQPDQGLSPGAL